MRMFILILFLLNSCTSNKTISNTTSVNFDNLFDLSINQYNELLEKYNENESYPNIEN